MIPSSEAERLRDGLAISLAACLLLFARRADAQEPCLDFRADRVVLDPARKSIELEGGVQARCGAYQLHADKLEVGVDDGDVDVRGPAWLTLCPCDRAPIHLGFERARLCPSGDIRVTDPTVRVGETSVLWLPWLWLRAPDRTGLLPPRLAWRGDGGLLVGPGVHVPWRESDGSLAWMDLYVSGYTRGGFEIEPSLVTASSRTTVRFDRMDGDLVRVASEGVTRTTRPGGLSWRVDAVGGSRGTTGLVDLREAARPFDDASAFLEVRPWTSTFVHAGVEATGPRGRDRMRWGPSLLADAGGALGSGVSWQASGALRAIEDDGPGAAQVTTAGARMLGGGWWGPVRLSLDGQGTLHATTARGADAQDVVVDSSSEAALPLIRHYASTTHLVEPFVRTRALGAGRTAEGPVAFRPPAVDDGARWLVTAGARTALGPPGGDRGVRWELAGGRLGAFDGDALRSALLTRLGIHVGLLDLQAQGAAVRRDRDHGAVATARVSMGASDTVAARAEVSSRTRVDPADALAFSPSALVWTPAGELSEQGTSLSLGGHLPFGAGFRAEVASDWDVGKQQWLATGAGLVLDHPCHCVQGRAWVSRRVGREGTDGWLALELR